MNDPTYEILVWLPSPIGDAILCTPALRAIRQCFKSSKISFFASDPVRAILSPNNFCDGWLEQKNNNPLTLARELKKHNFTHAVLFKNSFASALTAYIAGIPSRIGYVRDGRGFLLTQKLYPPRLSNGRFKPIAAIDSYLALASRLGANITNRTLELLIDPADCTSLDKKLPETANNSGPIMILVPAGAFGPSKCWPAERFAQAADWLIDNYKAMVIISVAPSTPERNIAEQICVMSKHKLINLAEKPISLSELKALFSHADLVISNDTGPRHIAIALRRNLISLFGPNDPAWTETGYEDEIQIIGNVACAPCTRSKCKKNQHLCMQAITVEMVCNAAQELLENSGNRAKVFAQQQLEELSKSFFIDPEYKVAFSKLGLNSIEAIFSFNSGKNLGKDNLASFRSRLQFHIDSPSTTLFIKRYDKPPVSCQLKNWLSHRCHLSLGLTEFVTVSELAATNINTPKVASYGEQWGVFFENRSFIITKEIADGESLERKLPDFFSGPATTEKLKLCRDCIRRLAAFIRKFHQTGYCHRDLYFSHIFYNGNNDFTLIDLARAFKPLIRRRRFHIKDIAQLHYSAPAKYFSRTDRLRFYLAYTSQNKLTKKDKRIINKVIRKAAQMAQHDIKHGRIVPFAG